MRTRLVFMLISAVVLFAIMSGCGEDVTAPVNGSPMVGAIADTTVILGDTLQGSVVATDGELDPLTYAVTALPIHGADDNVVNAGIDPTTGRYWFIPNDGDLPGRTLRFTVTDDNGNATKTDLHVTVTYLVDQVNFWDLTGGYGAINTAYATPIGQEFIPATHALDVVELRFSSEDTRGRVQVRIRDGSMSGPVLAESEPVDVPQSRDVYPVALFHFDHLMLTPQHVYALEIVNISGPNVMVMWGGDRYSRGRVTLFGNVNERGDLWFRTGTLPRSPGELEPPRPRTDGASTNRAIGRRSGE